jgi:hypothetical protein
MATRRERQGKVSPSKSPNYGSVTGGARSVRVLAKGKPGEASMGMLKSGTSAIRSVRTLIKRDEAKGITQPEYKQVMLMSTGVKQSGQSGSVSIAAKDAMPPSGANQRRIRKAPVLGTIRRRLSGV